MRYLHAARDAGLRRAVVSSSHNCHDVLVAAGIEDLLEVRVDGIVAEERGLRGKPAPDTFLEAARRRSASRPEQAAVFEDALAGVQAGRAGGFGYVVGVDRVGQRDGAARPRRRRRRRRPRRAAVIAQPALLGRAVGGHRGARSTSTCWRRPSRSSRSPTATSGCAATSTRASRYGLPGTYLNGFYETRPLPYAEAGYGYPEDGQTVVNVTNGKLIRLLVDDEPFDVRYGELLSHRRTLDLRAGVLRREVHWRSPAGREIEVRSARLVSFVQRSVAAIRYEVEPLDGETRIVVQSELVANEHVPARSEDPRAAAVLARAAGRRGPRHATSCAPCSCTARATSGLRMAAGMDHEVDGPRGHGHRRPRAATTSRA